MGEMPHPDWQVVLLSGVTYDVTFSGEHPLSRAALLDDDENERGDSSAPETALTRAANDEPKEL